MTLCSKTLGVAGVAGVAGGVDSAGIAGIAGVDTPVRALVSAG